MINCSNCGASNENNRSTCCECGMPISKSSGQGGTIKIDKSLLLIGGGLLVLVALIFGAVKLFTNQEKKISRAAVQTISHFSEAEQTSFQKFTSMAEESLKTGDFSTQIYFSGGEDFLEVEADYSRSAKKIRGTVTLNNSGLEFSVKKKEIQIRFPGEYEVYGFKLNDINKIAEKLNNAANIPGFGQLIPVKLPTNLDLDPFAKTTLKGILKSICGEEYKAFIKSVKIEKWNKETITLGSSTEECKVYKISWKSEAATELLGSLASGGVLPNVGSLVNSILPELSPYIYCYLDADNYLVAVRFTAAGAKCFLVLEGEDNPWDSMTLTAEKMSGEILVYSGGVSRNGSEICMRLQDGNKVICQLDYNDDNGEFSFSTASTGVLFYGNVISNAAETGIHLNWFSNGSGTQELRWIIGKLEQSPEPLGEKSSDLMSLTWSVLENLINDWMNH